MSHADPDPPVEFLGTYGWVMLVLILIVSVLLASDQFDAMSLLADSCRLERPLVCEGAKVSNSTGVLILVRNQLADAIRINQEDIRIELENGRRLNWGNCRIDGVEGLVLRPGNIAQISCAEVLNLPPKSRIKATIEVNYIKHTYPKPSNGVIYATVTP